MTWVSASQPPTRAWAPRGWWRVIELPLPDQGTVSDADGTRRVSLSRPRCTGTRPKDNLADLTEPFQRGPAAVPNRVHPSTSRQSGRPHSPSTTVTATRLRRSRQEAGLGDRLALADQYALGRSPSVITLAICAQLAASWSPCRRSRAPLRQAARRCQRVADLRHPHRRPRTRRRGRAADTSLAEHGVSSLGSGGRDVDQDLADRAVFDGLMGGGRIG